MLVKASPAFLAAAALLLHPGQLSAHIEECSPPVTSPTATEVAVSSVPIVVSSTTRDYFVLYANVGGREIPVQVKRGESGATTLEENVKALPASDYRVEKYLIADPADVDGDCVDDLADPSPLNHSHRVALDPADGARVIADHAHFEELASAGVMNIIVTELGSSTPEIYFQNTNAYPNHATFADLIGLEDNWDRGWLFYYPNTVLYGSRGTYAIALARSYASAGIERIHTLFASNMPVVDHNLAFDPFELSKLPNDWVHVANPRVPVVVRSHVFSDVDYSGLNVGEGYGRLRVLEPDDRPNPRDIVLYATLPNELSRVAGIISTQPQTPLSHVDLRATQHGIPNAFIRDAQDDAGISALIGQYVYFQVAEKSFAIRAATKAEVDAHYESLRPTSTQTPERDLSVEEITPLSEIGFNDNDAFGVKAANVAELGKLGLPEGTVPDGFAIPFHFYDAFMKQSALGEETVLGKRSAPEEEKITLSAETTLAEAVSAMLAHAYFQSDFDIQEEMLDDLRDAIEDATSPQFIIDALTAMHATYPEGQTLRYRSSTNNEDLPGFSGAGLYDSNTQKPEETENEGIDKSMKQVFASLWNFRAYVEREFYRIDHTMTAMGILVHPNYSDEKVNGVAVSFDPLYGKADHHYVNSQVGEDLVTNPDAHSLPEELLLRADGSYRILHYTNQLSSERLLMSESQMGQLRRHLDTIHDHFDELYGIEPYAIEIEFKITSTNVLAIKQARPWVFGYDAPQAPQAPPSPPSLPPPTPPGSSSSGSSGGGGFGPAPVAPSFVDGFRTQRELAQNAKPGEAIGDPVGATHPDDLDISYSLGGADAQHFAVDEDTGQLSMRDGMEPIVGNTYTVNLTATDSAGFGAIIIVTIEIVEPAHHPYDANANGVIERDEVISAVKDYFAGEMDKDEVIDLIKLYFAD